MSEPISLTDSQRNHYSGMKGQVTMPQLFTVPIASVLTLYCQ